MLPAQRAPKHEHFLGATKTATKTKTNLNPSQCLSVLHYHNYYAAIQFSKLSCTFAFSILFLLKHSCSFQLRCSSFYSILNSHSSLKMRSKIHSLLLFIWIICMIKLWLNFDDKMVTHREWINLILNIFMILCYKHTLVKNKSNSTTQ